MKPEEQVNVPDVPEAANAIVPTLEQLPKAVEQLRMVSIVEAVAAVIAFAVLLVQPDGTLIDVEESLINRPNA